MKSWFFGIICLVVTFSYAQEVKRNEREISTSPFIEGTIMVPQGTELPPLVIIIAGSGPTDRNGNQPMMKNNSLKFLAEGLYDKGIATFRYDKRIIKQLKENNLSEKDVNFNEFIEDARSIVDYFKRSKAFSKIYVVGHSQGSLVGMIAAQRAADGFISIAGAGQEIDDVIVDQLAKQAPGLKDNARQSFDDMRANGIALNYSPGLASIFREEIQPFLISWMQYNPQEEITKLDIPVLIINGDKDLQVQISEAEKLKAAKPDATLKIVPGMNHILKQIEGTDIDNSKTYNQPNLPVSSELIDIIAAFILN